MDQSRQVSSDCRRGLAGLEGTVSIPVTTIGWSALGHGICYLESYMMRAIKQTILNAVKGMGYTVIANWRVERYPEAVFLKKLFRMLEIDCVFDVGANLGQYHDFLRAQVDYEGIIVSFEPIPRYVEFLRNRAKTDSKWIIEGYALGSTAGMAPFNVMASTSFSSFLEPDHTAV